MCCDGSAFVRIDITVSCFRLQPGGSVCLLCEEVLSVLSVLSGCVETKVLSASTLFTISAISTTSPIAMEETGVL